MNTDAGHMISYIFEAIKLKTNCICFSSGPEPEPKLYTRTTRSPGNPNRNSPNDVNTSSSPGNVSIGEKAMSVVLPPFVHMI